MLHKLSTSRIRKAEQSHPTSEQHYIMPKYWSPEEDVLLMYFYSRRASLDAIREIIWLKLEVDVDANKLYPRIRKIKDEQLLAGGPSFHLPGSRAWDLEVVDDWLCEQMSRDEVLELIEIDALTGEAISIVGLHEGFADV